MMNGEQFVSTLVDIFKLKIGAATKSQWKTKKQISPTVLKNAFRMFEAQRFHGSITPLAEFHELIFDSGKRSFAGLINDKPLVQKLKQPDSIGIYAFFDASGRVVYIGKTEKRTLFSEMDQRYRDKPVSMRVIKKGKSCSRKAKISDVAYYFSAYRVEKYLITNVEALLTRVIINSASNIRVERFHESN
jgi:hypothetical protein